MSYDHFDTTKKQKKNAVETSPTLTPYYSIRAQELALRVIHFKELGVIPDSGMTWLRVGIRKHYFNISKIIQRKQLFHLHVKNGAPLTLVSQTIEIQI